MPTNTSISDSTSDAISNTAKNIIHCPAKDKSGLNDFQKLPNHYGSAIPRVGIERFRIPVNFRHPQGEVMSHDAEASAFVSVGSDKTGANMSRLCSILQEELEHWPVDKSTLKKILQRYRRELRDSPDEPHLARAELALKLNYPTRQKSLRSKNWGWQYYAVEIRTTEWEDEQSKLDLTLEYEYSSTCPCSLSMAKQYERDFERGRVTEGNGIATAHGQRSRATVTCQISPQGSFFVEELIALLRWAIPTETQSLVKRIDEQAFAIINGENPMFVEHVARRLENAFEQEAQILDWRAKIEHFESLHGHNAVAYTQKVQH